MVYEVIRRLGPQEVLYDAEVQNGNFILNRVFLVQTAAANEITLDLLKQACRFWVKRHPFLRAQIQRNADNYTERYYVHMAQSDAFAFNNVEILEERSDLTWRDVMDKEAVGRFDTSTNPLWRIKWVKLARSDESQESANHAFILTVNHAIGDGRNIYEIGVQLLNVVGALLENKVCVEMDESVVEHSLHSHNEMTQERNIQFENEVNEHDKLNRNPKLFSGHSDTPDCRFQHLSFEPVVVKKLLSLVKSKAVNSKLASVIGTVLSIAWRNLFKRLGVNDVPQDKFQYFLLVSIREKLGLGNTQMGIYSHGLHQTCVLSDTLCTDLENGRAESFWRLCDDQSSVLASKLKRNEEFHFSTYIDEVISQLRTGEFNDSDWNFSLSNIGVMRNTSSSVLRIREHYARIQCCTARLISCPFVGVTTVDGRLCLGFSYNENSMSTVVMGKIVEEVKRLINVIIS